MPPPSVMPPMPTEPVSPKPTASPCCAAAVVNSPALRPVSAQAVRLAASICSAFMFLRSRTMPPSLALWPAPLWPPLRTASSSPASRASLTMCATSAASAGRTMTAGRLSIPPIITVRALSYSASPGAITSPVSRVRRSGIEMAEVVCT